MQIITSNQIEYCHVINPNEDNTKPFPGVLYHQKLFLQIATYAKDQIQEAISYGREAFLVEKGLILFLVIEEDNKLTVWQEERELKLMEEMMEEKQENREQLDLVQSIKLDKLVKIMRAPGRVQIKDRLYHLKIYRCCFVGREAVRWLKGYLNISTEEAVALGQRLIDEKWIHHVLDEHSFENKYLFYRFYSDE